LTVAILIIPVEDITIGVFQSIFQAEVFWVVTPCSVVLEIQSEDGCSMDLLKSWYPTTTLHGVTTQKTSKTVKASKLATSIQHINSIHSKNVFYLQRKFLQVCYVAIKKNKVKIHTKFQDHKSNVHSYT